MVGPVTWQTAERDPDDDVVPRSQTRQTRPANTNKRWTWYGIGTLTRVEKNWFGRILDDVVNVFGDISVFGLPVLYYVWLTSPSVEPDLSAPALTVWAAMVATATLLRGGWIAPLGSETLGWVSTRYSLLPLRILYYNLTLLVAIYGSVALASIVGRPALAVVCAGFVGVLATLAFPTVADATYRRFVR